MTRPFGGATHTYAALDVSPAAYDEIAGKLRAAGYDHVFDNDNGAIDMHGIGLVREAEQEAVTVPVLTRFDNTIPIGWLKIRKDALPATPTFCFSIAFMALETASPPGTLPAAPYIGKYRLQAVALVSDDSYVGYLRQIGKMPPAPAPLHQPDEDGALNCICDQFQAPAASMCPSCPRRDAAVKSDLECWQMVMELRSEEAHSVDIFPDNADFNGQKNCAVECIGAWTGWCPIRYDGATLHEALTAAVQAMRAFAPHSEGAPS